MTAPDIVAIGEPLLEFNQTTPGEPQYLQGFGGDSSNMIIAAARSGARTAYVTRVGNDEFGRMFRALWESEGVDTRGVATDPQAHTAVYFVTHGTQGHVFSYLRASSAASRMRAADLPLDLIRSARFVHGSAISTAISRERLRYGAGSVRCRARRRREDLVRLQPAAQALVARAGARNDRHRRGMSDYFFHSLEDARALSGVEDPEANLDWAHRLGAKHVFLKLGPDGVIASDGARRSRIAGIKVKAVDATGAGDCFCGAALARLAAGDSLVDAARYANAGAALATTGFGAVAPLPRADEVRKLLGA